MTASDAGPATPPTDPDSLRADIAQTRAELGDTVEALAAKVDVKARAKDKATEVRTGVQAKAARLTRAVQDRTAPARTQLATRTAALGDQTRQAIPAPAAQAIARAAQSARQHPAPVLAAAAVALVFLLRRVSRGRESGE